MGTFTLNQRSGLILSLIRTLRYSFRDKAWYNALEIEKSWYSSRSEKMGQ